MSHNETYDVKQELESMSPMLASIPKAEKSNASVPDGYFDWLQDEIMAQAVIHGYDKSQLAVPKGYFDGLEGRILAAANETTPSKTGRSRVVYLMWALAACSILVLAAVFVIRDRTTTETWSGDAITQAEYFDYLQENVEDADIEQLADYGLLEDSDLTIAEPVGDSQTDEEEIFESEIDF